MVQTQMTVAEFRRHLSQYPTNFLMCKEQRHKWDVTQNFERQPDGWITRISLCARCTTRRTDFFALAAGQRLVKRYSNYAYPTGFSFHGLPQVESISEIIRFEAFNRSINDNYDEESTTDDD